MKIIQSADYRIYFDDVRVDPYVKSWDASVGLSAADAAANIRMHRTKELEEWKGYLTQVRIFGFNVFSGKFCMVFEGEITNRGWTDARVDTGEITFQCKGFYHWLTIPIPFLISTEDELNKISRFKYEAMNINVEAVESFMKSKEEILMKDKALKEILDKLFEMIYQGYNLDDDTAFEWANLQGRFKVMSEVVKEYREAGFMDAVTFTRSTMIESFYVYLNQLLSMMMLEFYQDRDGALRIKTPSWSDGIMKCHVIDESIVANASGFNDWENEPTRVLVIGGKEDYGSVGNGADTNLEVPMGLYIGKPGEGRYYAQNVEVAMAAYGVEPGYFAGEGESDAIVGGSAETAAYYLDKNEFRISTGFQARDSLHPDGHRGIDLARPTTSSASIEGKAVYSLTDGTVETIMLNHAEAGNAVWIKAPNGYRYRYIHLKEAPLVKEGDSVRAGQHIGKVGNTGKSTGPHLDLKIQDKNGTYLDPVKHLQNMAKGNPNNTDAAKVGSASAKSGLSGKETVTSLTKRDLKNQSNWNAVQLNNWINKKASKSSVMYNRGEAFAEAAKVSGLDPQYLVAHAAIETGWGTARIARDKHNFYGIGAFDNSPYKSAKTWTGADAGIIKGAKWISDNYYKKGQTTLYSMRFNNGVHQYATDPKWHTKIAQTWLAADPAPGAAGTPGAGESSSPNAATGGYTVTTTYSSSYVKDMVTLKTLLPGGKKIDTKKKTNLTAIGNEKPLVAIKYNSSFRINYPFQQMYSAVNFIKQVQAAPNGVPADMIASIIEVASGWKEGYKGGGIIEKYGLMGVPTQYAKDLAGISKKGLLDAEKNILHGTTIFSNAYARFGKVTFALASLYTGDMRVVENAINKIGISDFSKVRTELNNQVDGVANYVDKVITRYTGLYGGDYIESDPHIIIFKDNSIMKGVDEAVVTDAAPADYQSVYDPIMTDEERMYKLSLKISEQPLIRYPVEQNEDQPLTADEMVEKYAKYLMQLFRAESHGVNVNLSTCLPFLRPGYNMWFEPTRRDLVFYPTRITHNGSYGNGCVTTVTGAFVRDPQNYDDIEENIFVTTRYGGASGFGSLVKKSEMPALATKLRTMHNSLDEVITDARKAPTLNQLYSSAVSTAYVTSWSDEMTAAQIDKKIKEEYAKAPAIIKTRKAELKKIVDGAADYFTKMLLKTSY